MTSPLKSGAIFKPHGLHRDAAFEGDPPAYVWCLHCERAYVRGEYRPVRDLQMCPYTGCAGDAVIDAWNWNDIRENNPSYPENPEEGVVYPMYGTK